MKRSSLLLFFLLFIAAYDSVRADTWNWKPPELYPMDWNNPERILAARFGTSSDMAAGVLAVGAWGSDVKDNSQAADTIESQPKADGAGSVHLFEYNPISEKFEESGAVHAIPPVPLAHFGFAVALRPDGERLAIGAPDEKVNGRTLGAVYVFDRIPNTKQWVFRQKLVPTPLASDNSAHFGYSVDIGGDNTIVVGAYSEDRSTPSGNAQNAGALYIFAYNELNQRYEMKYHGRGDDGGDRLGESVAIQGNVALAGAPFVEASPMQQLGCPLPTFIDCGIVLRLQKHPGEGWSNPAIDGITPPEWQSYLGFGKSISIDPQDEQRFAVGTWLYDPPGGAKDSGYVVVYGASGAESVLTSQFAQSYSGFGEALRIDGDLVVVGAPSYDQPSLNKGAVSVFRRSTSYSETLLPLPPVEPDYISFGSSVSSMNEVVFVGSPLTNFPRADVGVGFIFEPGP